MTASRFQITLADQAVSSATNFGVALILLLTTSVAEFGRFGFAVTLALVVLSVTRAIASEPFILRAQASTSSCADSDAAAFWGATVTGLALLFISWVAVGLTGAVVFVCLGAGILGLQDHRRYVSFANGEPASALSSDTWWLLTTMALLAVAQPALSFSNRSMSASMAAFCWVAGAAVSFAATAKQTSSDSSIPNLRGSARGWLRSTSRLGKSFLAELLLERVSFQIGMIVAASYLIASDFGSLRVAHFVYGPVAILAGGIYTFLLSEFQRRTLDGQSSLVHRSLSSSWIVIIGTSPVWLLLPSSITELVPWDSSSSIRISLTLAHLTYGGWIVGAVGRAKLRYDEALTVSAGIRAFNGALFIGGVLVALGASEPLLGFLIAFAVASFATAIIWTIAVLRLAANQINETEIDTLTDTTTVGTAAVDTSDDVVDLRESPSVTHVISGLKFFENGALIGGHANALRGLVRAQATQADVDSQDLPEVLPLRSMTARSVGFGGVVHTGGITSFWRTIVRQRTKGSRGVLHFHIGYLDYVILAQLSRLARFERVIVTHYCPAPMIRPEIGGSLRGRLLRQMARGIEHISISENVQQSLRDAGIDSHVIAPAVDLTDFNDQQSDRTNRHATRFMFVGNLREEKNLVGLIRSFGQASMSNPQIRLVATIEDQALTSTEYGKLVAQEIERWNVRDKVEMVGVVNDMPSLMNSCDAMILPFLGTRGPSDYFLAGLEGLAAGLPLICTDVGAMAEVVDTTCGRLIKPASDQELTQAISAFAAGSLPTVTANKRTELVETFNPSRIAERMNSIYQEMEPTR